MSSTYLVGKVVLRLSIIFPPIHISTRGRVHLDIFATVPLYKDVTNFPVTPASPSSRLGAETSM
jgi:hypothetical protein